MAITEQQRSEIYVKLVDAVGQKGAEFLMAQQPSGGWEQLATKRDLADLNVRTQASFVEIHAKTDIGFAAADAKMEKGFAAVERKIAELSESRGRDFYAIILAIMVMGVAICGVVLAS